VWASEFYVRSGTISIAVMAGETRNCRIGFSIVYGIGRSPLVLATEVRDLDGLAGGRIVLGTNCAGQQHETDDTRLARCRRHVSPALRVEELVPLLRRLWHLHEGPIHHQGRFYRLDLVPTGLVDPPERDVPIYTARSTPPVSVFSVDR